MSDISTENLADEPHAWVHENLAAYLAGGLNAEERARLDAHVNACPECFDAFTEARDADRAAQRALAALLPAGDAAAFEERIITHTREATMNRWKHPMVRRAAYATAAAIALAATGVFANFAMHQGGRMSNPLSRELAIKADEADPSFGNSLGLLDRGKSGANKPQSAERAIASYASSATLGADSWTPATQPNAESIVRHAGISPSEMDKEASGKVTAEARKQSDSTLVADANKLYEAHDYKDSAQLLQQAVTNDPSNPIAKAALRDSLAKLSDSDAYAIERRAGQEIMRQNIESADHLVPYPLRMEIASDRKITTLNGGQAYTADFAYNDSHAMGYQDPALANENDELYEKKMLQTNVGGVIASNTLQPNSPGSAIGGTVTFKNGMLTPPASAAPSSFGIGGIGNGYLSFDQVAKKADANEWKYVNGPGQTAFNSTLSSAAPLTKSGGGTVTVTSGNLNLTGNNAFVGGTVISAGSLQGSSQAVAGRDLDVNGNVAVVDARTNLSEGTSAAGKFSFARGLSGDTALFDQNSRSQGESAVRQAGENKSKDEPAAVRFAQGTNFGMPVGSGDDTGVTQVSKDLRVVSGSSGNGTTLGDTFAVATPGAAGVPGSQGSATRPAPTQQPAQAPQAVAQLKIIRNGTIEFEVRSFDDAYMTVAKIVGDDGGFVSSTSSEKLANGHVRGIIVVRVPPERLERFLLELRSLGDLKAQQIAANDVTKQYTDTESELRGLRTMETRLLDLIKNGKGEVKDLVEAEKQLGDYRVRIEKLEGELSYYNNLVSLATISITAYEKDIAKPTAAFEQEAVNLSVETEEVEAQYQAARKTLDDAKARIVESQLRNTDAEHVAAHIVADVPPDKADFVAGQLKTLGKVASFNRDRRQTTTGGTGAPSVEVEHKDTRITIELFNLANLAPRETTVIRVAVPDVEGIYSEILGKIRAAAPDGDQGKTDKTAGRVKTSTITGQLPEQMVADINAEVRSENATDVLAAIRKSGEVLTSSVATNSDNASTTGAKRGIQLTLVNIAAIPPKEIHTLNIAVRDVDKAYRDLLAVVNKEVTKDEAAANPLLPPIVGRVVNSAVNGQQPEQMTADVRAQIRTEKMTDVLAALENAAGYEVMSNSIIQSPEAVNFTRVKEGLEVHFINVATIAARESRIERLVAVNVEDSYKKLQASLSTMAARGDARLIASNLDQNDARNVVGVFKFEVRRDALPQIDKAFADAGIDFLTGNTIRSNDPNTLDSKVYFQIDELRSTDTLAPRRTIALTLEVDNIDKSLDGLRESMKKLLPPGEGLMGTDAREIEFNVSRDGKGNAVAKVTLDVPKNDSARLQQAVNAMQGIEKDNQVSKNSAVPDKEFARERYELTVISQPKSGLLPADKGVGQSARAALSSASGALVLSLYYVLTGLLFILPFALILWPVWAILKRKRKPAAA